MAYQVRIEQVTSKPIAVVRRRTTLAELPKVVPAGCGTVWNVVRSQKLTGAGRHIAVYLDAELDRINLEVGVELDAPFAGDGDVVPSATPAGTAATLVHYGPYRELGQAHQAIRQWCADEHHAMVGPNWEIYGHWLEEWNNDPSKIRTDVYYLLQGESP
jgi:effector-binding domain-containing protein